MSWLDPLKKALDSIPHSVSFFFRNDDAGWEDARLFELVYLFARHNVPIDLAVIPRSISTSTAARLRNLAERFPDKLSLHQHGYAHLNHELNGRKCEFGETRSRDLQLADINHGKELLRDLFGPITAPIFTPPWNRCTSATADCLREASFTLLSRDITASPLNARGLMELPIAVDWFAKRKGIRLAPNELADSLGAAAQRHGPVGLMLHHALMDEDDCARLGELLQLVSSHPQARCVLMRDLIPAGELTS
jgi:hypothetical protein